MTCAFVVLWGGVVVAHLVNVRLGDEVLGPSFYGLVAFDAVMAVGLAIGNLQTGSSSSTAV